MNWIPVTFFFVLTIKYTKSLDNERRVSTELENRFIGKFARIESKDSHTQNIYTQTQGIHD